MTTRENLLKLAKEWQKFNPESKMPEFIIYTFECPDSKVSYYVPWLGYTMTFPSPGIVEDASFYGLNGDLDQAIQFLNENKAAVQDGCYFAAFIVMRVPGIYPFNTPETRMFFRWDEEKQGFFQEEEPEVFRDFPILLGAYALEDL